jgi:hypothetical protein
MCCVAGGVVTTQVQLGVRLEVDHCPDASDRLFVQMSSGAYAECAAMMLPQSLEEWRADNRTARKRADRAYRRGYVAMELYRELYADDIHAINTSAAHRQGRPMAPSYLERTEYSPLPEYPCARHATRITGVWAEDGSLVAYLVMLRSGDLALVSQILGHADHLPREVMFLLFQEALRREVSADPHGVVVYNRWDSGSDGLRTNKELLGFEPMPVGWLP